MEIINIGTTDLRIKYTFNLNHSPQKYSQLLKKLIEILVETESINEENGQKTFKNLIKSADIYHLTQMIDNNYNISNKFTSYLSQISLYEINYSPILYALHMRSLGAVALLLSLNVELDDYEKRVIKNNKYYYVSKELKQYIDKLAFNIFQTYMILEHHFNIEKSYLPKDIMTIIKKYIN